MSDTEIIGKIPSKETVSETAILDRFAHRVARIELHRTIDGMEIKTVLHLKVQKGDAA